MQGLVWSTCDKPPSLGIPSQNGSLLSACLPACLSLFLAPFLASKGYGASRPALSVSPSLYPFFRNQGIHSKPTSHTECTRTPAQNQSFVCSSRLWHGILILESQWLPCAVDVGDRGGHRLRRLRPWAHLRKFLVMLPCPMLDFSLAMFHVLNTRARPR